MNDNKKNINLQQGNSIVDYQRPYPANELTIRELITVIWSYKWLTALMCTVAIAGSIFYVLSAQEWWVAKAEMIKPQLNDVGTLYSQSKNVGVIINASSDQPNQSDVLGLMGLYEPSTLFKAFILSFNSSLNKKLFLESNSVFLQYLSQQGIKLPSDELTAESQLVRETYRKELNNWMTQIKASLDPKSGEASLYLRSNTKESSALLLNDYIIFVSEQVKLNQSEKFLLYVNSAKQELAVSIDMIKKNVEQELAVMLKKTEYAYQIASQAGLSGYQTNLNPNAELFEINLGEKALKAKVAVLKSLTDFSLLDSTILQKQITLDSLNNITLIDNQSFVPFRYLEVVQTPFSRAEPKRALIVILATLLAVMFSIFIALVHYFLTKKEN